MQIKKTITTCLVLSFLISLTFTATASDATYTKAVKPALVLTAVDVTLIEEAIDNNFKKLSKSEIKKLTMFLKDYLTAVQHEKKKKGIKPSPLPKPRPKASQSKK